MTEVPFGPREVTSSQLTGGPAKNVTIEVKSYEGSNETSYQKAVTVYGELRSFGIAIEGTRNRFE